MASKKKAALKGAKASSTLDTKAMSEEIGATVKEGRVSVSRGKYYLTTGGKKLEILVPDKNLSDIKTLAGQVVAVIVAKGGIIAVGRPGEGGRCYFGCYVPPPPWGNEINELFRSALIDKCVNEGVFSKPFGEQLKEQPGPVAILR